MIRVIIFIFVLLNHFTSISQTIGSYSNVSIPNIGGNTIIQPTVPPVGVFKSSVKVSGHFRGEVYIEPNSGKIHVNNAYPNGEYRVDVFGPNGLSTNFILTVAGTECKYKGRFQFSREIIDIPSKASRAVDINRDGLSDLLLLRQDIGGVTLLLNSKSGFVKKTEIILGFVPELFDVGDLNNDGHLDIIATNNVEQSILIIYGAENSTFLTPISIRPLATIVEGEFLVENPKKLIVQDINNDAFSDIIIFSPSQGMVFIGLGKEDNTFDFSQSIASLGINEVTGDIKIADFTNDQTWEIVVEMGIGGTMYIITNQQNKFSILTSIQIGFSGGGGIPELEIFDINADTILDIYYTDGVSGSALFLGLENNGFLPPETYALGPYGGLNMKILDLNGDKYVDFFQYISPNNLYYSASIGNGFIVNSSYYDPVPVQEFSDVTIIDINGDRILDVCISDLSGSTSILIGTQNYFSEKIIDPGFKTEVGNLLTADFSKDGFSDIIVSNPLLPEFYIYKGNNNGTHDFFRSISLPLVGEVGPRVIEMGDLNNDGFLDLLIAMGSDSVFIYKGIDQGDFEILQLGGFATTFKQNSAVMRMHMLDYNNDGFKDIIFLNQTSICVSLGNGDFTFKNVITDILNIDVLQITGFEVRDITNDGFPELFFSDASADHLVIYTGNKNAQFAYSNRIIIPGVEGFSIGDYDNDLIDDLVVGVPQNGLVLYRGTGSLSFVNDKLLYSIDPYNLVGKDLDGDLLNELIFWNNGGSMQVLFFDKNRQQMLEQTTNFYSPIQGPIFFGDFGNVLNTVPDGITDIYFRTEAGITKLLINESLNNRIFDQNTPITELVLCDNQNYLLKISDNSSTSVQWESSFDGETYGAITGQNSYQINYTQTRPLSFLRAKLTNESYCPNASPYYTKPLRIQYQDYSQFNPLNDFYTSCDSLVTINIQPGFKNFQWSNGDTLPTTQLKYSSDISIALTDSLKCILRDTASVEIQNLNLTISDTLICKGADIRLTIDSSLLKYSPIKNEMQNGLIFYAPMDGNSNDLSLNFLQKTEFSILYDTDRHQIPEKAATFSNGSSVVYDYIPLVNQNSYTLSIWIKLDSAGSLIRMPQFGLVADRLPDQGLIRQFSIETLGGSSAVSPGISYGEWHHVLATYDKGLDRVSLYIDGKNVSTVFQPQLFAQDATNLIIGGNETNGQSFGKFDDVAIWNRPLTDFEISKLAKNKYQIEWSNGEKGYSIFVKPDSTQTFFARVINGISYCEESINVEVLKIDTSLTISSVLPKCILDSVSITAKPGFAYQWYKDDNIITDAILNTFSTTDTGRFRVSIKNSNGCIDTSSDVYVANISQTASFSVNDTIQSFSNNAFIFSNLSTVTGLGGLNYIWDFGDGNTSIEVSPIHVYDSVGVYRVKLLSTSDQGCEDSSFLDVTVNSSLLASFRVSDTTQCLAGNSFVFTDQSITDGGAVSYNWDFGDGAVSSVQNPVHSYTGAGNYIVRLLVVNGGERDSSELIVRVEAMPIVSFSVSDTLQCLSGNSYVFNNLTVVPSGGAYTYRWDFGDGDSSLLASPRHAYAGSGSYNVRLIGVNGSGCADTSIVGIEVYGMPVSSFSVNDTLQCLSSNNFIFDNTSILSSNELPSYNWSYGDNNSSLLKSPNHVYGQQGKYRVELIVVSSTGCSDTSSVDVDVYSIALKKIIVNDTLQCITNNLFKYIDSTNYPANLSFVKKWELGDGVITSLQNPIHTYKNSGTFIVKLKVNDTDGCFDSTQLPIIVTPQPNGIQYEPVNAVRTIPVQINAREGKAYQWAPSIGLSSSFLRDPIARLEREQKYYIKIATESKCIVTDTLLVRVLNSYDIFVPEGFTPNQDGNNDKIYPILVGIKTMNIFKIFDRWGNLIYSRPNANSSTGWDGMINGKSQPTGGYVWVAEGIDLENNIIRRTGKFVLIR